MNDVILLVLESVRADYFTKSYFPRSLKYLDEFAHFVNGYSNGVATPLSYHSIHTGYPIESDSALPDSRPTIAELYDGYSFAISNNIHLLSGRGYDRGFDSFTQIPRTDPSSRLKTTYFKVRELAGKSNVIHWAYNQFQKTATEVAEPRLSPEVNRSAENILSIFSDEISSTRGFFWTHLADTHYPFYPQKVLDKDIEVEYTNREIKQMNDRFRAAGLQRADSNHELDREEITFLTRIYGEIIRYVDRQLADFFGRLKESDRWNDVMIVMFADHGECFGEEGLYGHNWTYEPVDPLIRVPITIKYPNGQYSGKRYDHPVQTGDLLATLAELYDWEVEVPPYTRLYSNSGKRPIISKSNTAFRVITENGSAIRTDAGIRNHDGVDSESLTLLENSAIPRADDLSGNIPGLDEREQKRVDRRLEHLGYKS